MIVNGEWLNEFRIEKYRSTKAKVRINPDFLRRGCLKNKANFRMGRMSLSIYMIGDYEDLWAMRRRKNKPNSKPIKANFINLSTTKWVDRKSEIRGRMGDTTEGLVDGRLMSLPFCFRSFVLCPGAGSENPSREPAHEPDEVYISSFFRIRLVIRYSYK